MDCDELTALKISSEMVAKSIAVDRSVGARGLFQGPGKYWALSLACDYSGDKLVSLGAQDIVLRIGVEEIDEVA